ncbi:MAG: CBS domain-containing protein [Nitrospirae bacterium]|nr:CBS domain-containing protein [Nitrospirota bacterium]
MSTLDRVMSRYLKKTNAQASIGDVAKKMLDVGVGALLVERDGELFGMVTEGDIVQKVIAEGKDCATTRVEDIMEHHLNTIRLSNTLQETLDEMGKLGVRHLVVQHEGKTVGIVTLRDILEYLGWLYEQRAAKDS